MQGVISNIDRAANGTSGRIAGPDGQTFDFHKSALRRRADKSSAESEFGPALIGKAVSFNVQGSTADPVYVD